MAACHAARRVNVYDPRHAPTAAAMYATFECTQHDPGHDEVECHDMFAALPRGHALRAARCRAARCARGSGRAGIVWR